jgi:hypothetical protein
MPYFHGVSDHLDDAPGGDNEAGDQGGMPEAEQTQGDGLHHHEMHEDEGGGWHSMHTHPDGRQEPGDHTSYEEASDHMDAMCGQGGDDGEDAGDDGAPDDGEMDDADSEPSDVAGSYGRAHKG